MLVEDHLLLYNSTATGRAPIAITVFEINTNCVKQLDKEVYFNMEYCILITFFAHAGNICARSNVGYICANPSAVTYSQS